MSEETNQVQEFTPEEIQEMKANQMAFYEDRIEFMKTQLQYETLVADIEEQSLRQLVAKVRQAQLLAPPQEPQEESEAPKRTLKKS